MRRMVKESLLKFDGKPLFPERIAETVPYKLSDAEAHLYKEVTDYVRNEFDRAEALANEKQAGTVGFALLSCSAGLRLRLRQSTNLCVDEATAYNAACESLRYYSAVAWRTLRLFPVRYLIQMTLRTWKTRPMQRSKSLRRNSSTRRQPHAPLKN